MLDVDSGYWMKTECQISRMYKNIVFQAWIWLYISCSGFNFQLSNLARFFLFVIYLQLKVQNQCLTLQAVNTKTFMESQITHYLRKRRGGTITNMAYIALDMPFF
jgi:hypothetical protein